MIEKLKEIIANEKGVDKDSLEDNFEITGQMKIEVKDEDGNVKNKQTRDL